MENQESEVTIGSDAESSSVTQLSLQDYVNNFLNLVWETFGHQPETYREFIRLMQDFKDHRIRPDHLCFEVHLLFKEHKELLKGFNQLLPENYRAFLGLRDMNYDDVLAFAERIELRFLKEPNVYQSFLQILSNRTTGTYDRADAFVEISNLFEGHPDLLREYWEFGSLCII